MKARINLEQKIYLDNLYTERQKYGEYIRNCEINTPEFVPLYNTFYDLLDKLIVDFINNIIMQDYER